MKARFYYPRHGRVRGYILLVVMFGAVGLHAQEKPLAGSRSGSVPNKQDASPLEIQNDRSEYMYPVQTWVSRERRRLPLAKDAENAALQEKASLKRMNEKLQRIVVPQVLFDHTRLTDAIEFLRRESIRLDSDDTSVRRGVEISVPPSPKMTVDQANDSVIPGLPPTEPFPSPANPADSPVTLALYKVPLLQALRSVAEQVGLKLRIDAKSVQLVGGCTECGEIETKEFLMPGFLEREIATGKDAKTSLEGCGMTFPPGTSASYLPATHKLILRNTRENLDLLGALKVDFSSQNASTPSPANP